MLPDPRFGRGVPRRIAAFHQDDEGHWIADLECGHTQHVRHLPPWQRRPWVLSEEGRNDFLGKRLPCVECPHPTERSPMLEPPEIVETPLQTTAVIRLTVPRAEISKVMGPAITEVMTAVSAQGIAPAGPLFSHHLRMDAATFDFEVGVPVDSPVEPVGRVQPSRLPASTVARTVYRGPYEGLAAAWGEIDDWIAAEGLTPAGTMWECYVSGPESGADPAEWRTQLNRPLVR